MLIVYVVCDKSAQVPANDMAPEVIISNGMNGYSIFWGGLVRIDVLKVVYYTLSHLCCAMMNNGWFYADFRSFLRHV